MAPSYPRIHVDFALSNEDSFLHVSDPFDYQFHTAEEEIR